MGKARVTIDDVRAEREAGVDIVRVDPARPYTLHTEIDQGDIDWFFLRAGRVTASRAGSLVTPAQRRPSAAAQDYALELALERILEAPLEMDLQNAWMGRGLAIEPDARRWYAMHTGHTVTEVAFVERTDIPVGCSPDGVVLGPDRRVVRGAEIKCRSAKQHARAVLGWRDIADETQIQFSLWVTGADAWDSVAYCPGFPGRIVTHTPDPEWQALFDVFVPVFLRGVQRVRAQLEAFAPVRWDDELDGQLIASIRDLYTTPTGGDE